MRVCRKVKKSAPKTTTRQQSVIKAKPKKNFLFKIDIQMCDGWRLKTMSGNKVIMSLKITQQQRMSSLFVRPSFTAKVFLWLTVREYDVSEPVFFKFGLVVNKELYIFKYLPVLYKLSKITTKRIKSCSGLIWRLHTT
jgi:hypothetical protein